MFMKLYSRHLSKTPGSEGKGKRTGIESLPFVKIKTVVYIEKNYKHK